MDPIQAFDVLRFEDSRSGTAPDLVATEAPLEVRLEGQPFSVIMRTPGADSDLAAGFLFTEGVVTEAGQIQRIDVGPSPNVINVSLASSRATIVPALLGQRLDLVEPELSLQSTLDTGTEERAAVQRYARRDWIAVHTPGHTGDHLCLYDPEHGLFVSGDHVLPTITPHIAGVTAAADPLAAFFASLRRMHDFEVTTVLPAHGHPFHDLAGRADAIARHHDERLDILRKVGRTELPLGTVPEFMRYLFRERSWGDMAESETFAHLEHLHMLGEATVTEIDGLLAYAISD